MGSDRRGSASRPSRWLRHGVTLLSATGLLVLIGCSDDGLPRRYPVTGTIKYKGQPVPHGQVTFDPVVTTEGRTATGLIKDGRYSLETTSGNNDGAIPGKYRVGVVSTEVDFTQAKARAGGGAGRQDDTVAANKAAKSLVPMKYSSPVTSGVTAEVKAQSNKIDFDLSE